MIFFHLAYIACILLSWAFVESYSLPIPEIRHLDDYTIYPPDLEKFEIGLYPLFEFLKITRGVFIFWVSYNFLKNTEQFNLLVYLSAICLVYSLMICLKQRYIHGVNRVFGNLAHSNSLSTFTAMHAVVVLMGAVREKKFLTSIGFMVAASCALLTVILAISRAGLLVIVLGYIVIAIFTLKRYMNMRNVVYITTSVIIFLGCLYMPSTR